MYRTDLAVINEAIVSLIPLKIVHTLSIDLTANEEDVASITLQTN